MPGVTPSVWHWATTLAAPALRHMLRRRARRGKEWADRLPEREGIDPTPRPPGRLIWLHAASVGESVSILPLLPFLQGVTVLLTTGTVTSAALLAERLPTLETGPVLHRFVPLDVPRWAARFLDHWRPDAAAFVESELWPNILAACRRRQIPLMLLNARMSARSARGWARVPGFAHEILGSFTAVQAQSPTDAARLAALGARHVTAPGDLKLAAPPLPADPTELARLQTLTAGRPIWLAASTHPGEEAIAIRLHHRLSESFPTLLTIIAPRHPARGPGIEPAAPHRSRGEDPGALWIADTLGELGLLYRLAPITLIGRSLLRPGGGQNPWEPARLGCALVVGPHTANFERATTTLRHAGALTVVQDESALEAWLRTMLSNATLAATTGQAAEAASTGLSRLPQRTAETILELIQTVHKLPPLPLAGEGRGEGGTAKTDHRAHGQNTPP